MKVSVPFLETQLQLLDEVVEAGAFGKGREEVLRAVVLEHAAYILAGGGPDDPAPWTQVEAKRPAYGPQRYDIVLQPGEGKAIPVYKGEVLRMSQLVGGQCIDFNAYNLHDYKEYLDCGFNRQRGFVTGPGTVVFTNSPHGRPIFVIRDASESCDQYYAGNRCNGVLYEKEYGLVDHASCEDAFTEAIREYRLTADDVHTSYNFWMKSIMDATGRRNFGHGRSVNGDYVELVATMDMLAVPVTCPAEVHPINNFDPQPVLIAVHDKTEQTSELVELVNKQWGGLKMQKTWADFKVKEILAERELRPDPSYKPEFRPFPRRRPIDMELSDSEVAVLRGLMRTDLYGQPTGDRNQDIAKAMLIAFMRWFDTNRTRQRYQKLSFIDQQPAAMQAA